MRGGGGEVADGVGEESLSLTEDYSHPSLIVADVGRTFPKFGTNFLCPVEAHNFLPGSTKLHMLSCNSTYFPGKTVRDESEVNEMLQTCL